MLLHDYIHETLHHFEQCRIEKTAQDYWRITPTRHPKNSFIINKLKKQRQKK